MPTRPRTAPPDSRARSSWGGRCRAARLYWTARGVFVTDRAQVRAFDAVFAEVFGARERRPTPSPTRRRPSPRAERAAGRRRDDGGIAGSGDRTAGPPGDGDDEELRDLAVPVAASDEEVLRSKQLRRARRRESSPRSTG